MRDSEFRFDPAWWLPGPHAQTLGARFRRPRTGTRVDRQRLTTPDGDFLDLDCVVPDRSRRDVLAILLHGLEGSAGSGYIIELRRRLLDHGIPSAALNFRSCSGEPNRTRRLYHSGETTDIAWVIERMREAHPDRRLVAAGVSLGGNVLLKHLGETGGLSGLDAAAAWSIPFDLAAGARFMETGFAAGYVRSLLRSLQEKLRLRADELGPHIMLEEGLSASTFRQFDDAVTAPLHGFSDADDYYRKSSSAGFIPHIRTPTLIIHSRDDPFMPADAIPYDSLDNNPSITPVITEHGGHVGFVAGGNPFRPHFWAEDRIACWLAEQLDDPQTEDAG